MLIRQIYVSRSLSRSHLDLDEILAWSRRVNVELGITGVLLYLDEVYMQYLEGEEGAVDALFTSIKADSRHQVVTPLDRRAIEKRVFPEWAMALLEWTPETKAIFHSFSPGTNLDLYAGDPETAAPLIRALSRAPGWKLVVGQV
jgi:hypothetical protein